MGRDELPSRPAAGLELRLFGPFTARNRGQSLPALRTRKGQWLLALLALRAGNAVSRSWLASALWPDSPEPQSLYNLRRTLSDLRNALGREADRLSPGAVAHSLTLDLHGATVDIVAFDEAIARGDVASLEQAAWLYRGELLEGCLEEWVLPEREARERALATALETLASHAAAHTEWATAERHLRRALRVDPLHESAQRALMLTLVRSGNPNAALQSYRDFCVVLARELKAEPDPETFALFRQIRSDVRRRLEPSPAARGMAPASTPSRGNLPHPSTVFLGREHAIDEVQAGLQQTRLLTLTGTGGVGKTRLALRVAAQAANDYEAGSWFVDLAALADGALAVCAVASTLAVCEEGPRPLIDTLCASVADKTLLLVLDNCEHIIQESASLADTLLRRCPHLRILATSRQALDVDGELVWRVPSLSVPHLASRLAAEDHQGFTRIADSEAVRLFVARAAVSGRDFTLTAANAATVAEICTRLDGIPLAIELAAVRIRVLSAEQIAARLQDRFRLLTGHRTAVPRHQTLRATLDWSHDLLSATEQACLRRLSVFAGGATLDAAEAVCAGELVLAEDVLDLMTSLVDKSMVVVSEDREGECRYDFLETIRHYGQERLAYSGEGGDTRARHAEFFQQWAERAEPHLGGPQQDAWLRRLEADHNNLRAALTFSLDYDPPRALSLALALYPFWEVRGHYVEGLGWLQRACHRSPDAPTNLRARAACAAGRLAWYQAALPAARALLEESLALFESLEERRGTITALGSLGPLCVGQGDYARARAVCERAVAEARTLGDRRILASQLQMLEMVAGTVMDMPAARALNDEVLVLCREIGDRRGTARALMGLGMIAAYTGDAPCARGHFLESLALSRALGDSWLMCGALLGLGHAERVGGDVTAAHGHYAESLTLCRKSNSNWELHLFEALAALAADEGDLERAVRLLGASEALREARGFALFPFLQPEHDRVLSAARRGVDPDAFSAAWNEGRTLSIDQAVAFAIARA